PDGCSFQVQTGTSLERPSRLPERRWRLGRLSKNSGGTVRNRNGAACSEYCSGQAGDGSPHCEGARVPGVRPVRGWRLAGGDAVRHGRHVRAAYIDLRVGDACVAGYQAVTRLIDSEGKVAGLPRDSFVDLLEKVHFECPADH